jgi:hypothetical protein
MIGASMRHSRSRYFAVGGLAAGTAAGLAALFAALGAPAPTVPQANAADATITYRSVAFGHGGVGVQQRPGGLLCFTVNVGSSTVARSCTGGLNPDQIEYASSRYAVGGLLGAEVRAVIVRLTSRGTVWAKLKNGAFYAAVPKGHNVRAVVKVLAGGKRQRFTVTGSR